MTVTLGLNISSLRSQRQLGNASEQLSTVFERLSSGQRINRASDDAAGLAIADSLNVDARVYGQGVRNLNDGISLLNIADSSLENLSSILVRLQELAEQSANGVYGDSQRLALDAEAQSLSNEFRRISQSVEFNGQKLFNGDTTSVNLQAGVGSNAVLSLGVGGAIGTGAFEPENIFRTSVAVDTYGLDSADINNDGNLDIVYSSLVSGFQIALGNGDGTFQSSRTVGDVTLEDGVYIGDVNNDGNLDIVGEALVGYYTYLGNGDGTFGAGITSSVGTPHVESELLDLNHDGNLDIFTRGSDRYSIQLGAGDGTFALVQTFTTVLDDDFRFGDFNSDGVTDLIASYEAGGVGIYYGNGDGTFNTTFTDTGVSTTLDGLEVFDANGDGNDDFIFLDTATSTLNLYLGDGSGSFQQTLVGTDVLFGGDIDARDFNGDGITDLFFSGGASYEVALGDENGQYTLQPYGVVSDGFVGDRELGDFNNDGVYDVLTGGSDLTLVVGSSVDGVSPLLEFSLAIRGDALRALPVFQNKLTQLSSQRSEIGAHLSRIESATSALSAAKENFQAAESRIRDADIAFESSRLVRLNILQQASAAVLAQANQQPALALRLLGGAS